jgi:predicted hydrocarbon binding protein
MRRGKRKEVSSSAKKHASRHMQVPKQQGNTVYDLEDLLIEMLVGAAPGASNGTDIENLIYSATGSTAELGYDFGFSVGRSMALKLGRESGMASVLDRIGLKDSTYNPFADEVMITSRSRKHHPHANVGHSIHVYESGVIAGYLSTSTGIRINASENRCTCNGASECQFLASHLPKRRFIPSGAAATISGIASVLSERKFSKPSVEYYRILACVPLLDPSMSEQVEKIMFMAGQRMSKLSADPDPAYVVENVSNYFGATSFSVKASGRKSIIRLRYESYNSIRPFVGMPAAILSGFYSSRGYRLGAHFTRNSNGGYTNTIKATRKI